MRLPFFLKGASAPYRGSPRAHADPEENMTEKKLEARPRARGLGVGVDFGERGLCGSTSEAPAERLSATPLVLPHLNHSFGLDLEL